MIVFAGTIGIGKSTYSKVLADHLGTKLLQESVDDNPILAKYYEDPERYAFALQIYFLNKRFHSIKEAFTDENNVLDRSIYEDVIFTRLNTDEGNISEEEFAIYLDLFHNMLEELEGMPKKSPDLLVFLDGSLDRALENIKKRGRPYEQVEGNPELLAYYEKLYSYYENWYDDYDESAKVRINVEELDIYDEEDRKKILEIITDALEEARA